MPQCIIVADDLTGANASGVLLKKESLKTVSLMDFERFNFDSLAEYDVVACSADSRAIEKELAYKQVYDAVCLFRSNKVKLFNKRIDSTLRGNLGSEIDGMLDALGKDYIAVVVPCFPQSGRIAVGGYLLVNGVILHETDAAKDPKAPVKTSMIEKIIQKQTKYKVKSIYLETVYKGEEAIKNIVSKAVLNGYRIVIIDAITENDLDVIAKAVTESDIPFTTVDPGPFTVSVAKKILCEEKRNSKTKKILLSIGSITNLTQEQLKEVDKQYKLHIAHINTKNLLSDTETKKQEINKVTNEILSNQENFDLFCITTTILDKGYKLDLEDIAKTQGTTVEELSLRINHSIAEISHNIFRQNPYFEGIFSSGGDITVAICKEFEASGIELIDEVIPLAAYGKLIGGEFSNLKIVTKGGMVGDKNGIVQCIQSLKEKILH